MNYIIVLLLAWIFGSSAFFCYELLTIPLLAQSFLLTQGLGSAESGIVLLYSEHFGLCRKRRAREKESPKYKTKPFQSHSKPFFSTPIFDSSEKTRIFDKFRQTFLCKTKPFFSKIQFENKGLTAVSQSSAVARPERAPRVERAL